MKFHLLWQILKEFKVSAKPRISLIPENVLRLRETERQKQKENEFEEKHVSVKHNKINPSPLELKGAKLKRLKDNHEVLMLKFDESDCIKHLNVNTLDLAEKKSDHLHWQVSEERRVITQELLACKDQSLSD